MVWRRLLEAFDWAARTEFAGHLLDFIFDWRKALWALVPSGGAMTFLWAAIEGRSPLDVWVLAALVMGGLAAFVYFALLAWERTRRRRIKAKPSGDGRALNETLPLYIDAKSRELAGLANAILERAGSYNFKLPLPADDPFIKQHEELKNSPHPIWTDIEINQLRRDFLQYCSIIGTRDEVGYSSSELREVRAQLDSYGKQLIIRLKGEKLPEEKVPLFGQAASAMRAPSDIGGSEQFVRSPGDL
jgi:hypothetical protein